MIASGPHPRKKQLTHLDVPGDTLLSTELAVVLIGGQVGTHMLLTCLHTRMTKLREPH